MKIALDISQIAYKGTGVARFTDGLVRAVCKYDSDNEWVFFYSSLRNSLNPAIRDIIGERNFRVVELKIPPKALSLLWNQLHIIRIDQFIPKVDWVITSDWTEPPSRYKKATIVHDLVFKKYPDTVTDLVKTTQEQRLNWVKKESNVIFADSNSTKQDLESLLEVDQNKITVNYPGVDQPTIRLRATGFKLRVDRPFILTVGKLEPRKNIEKLVNAFNSLNQKEVDLYIVGMNGWGNIKIEQSSNIKLLGFVSDAHLANLYQSCLFFVMPSIYEGFGYPVVEAMSYGAPVTTSNVSSLREIAADAALLFDPSDEKDIANALKRMISSDSLRTALFKKGRVRAKDFSWKRYYDTMIKVLSSKF